MTSNTTQHNLQTVLANSPQLQKVIAEIKNYIHSCHVTVGSFLPEVIPRDFHSAPMLIVSSDRMSDNWRPELFNGLPQFTIDGFVSRIHSSPYWTWKGAGLSLAFKAVDVADVLCDAQEMNLPILVVWIGDQVITIDALTLSQDYLDLLSEAYHVSYFPRFVPDRSYAEAKLAELPPILAADESRFIGEEGEPVYIVRVVSKLVGDKDIRLTKDQQGKAELSETLALCADGKVS